MYTGRFAWLGIVTGKPKAGNGGGRRFAGEGDPVEECRELSVARHAALPVDEPPCYPLPHGYRYVRNPQIRRKAAGVPDAWAKAEAEALVSAFSEAMDKELATKWVISRMERALAALNWRAVLGGIAALVLNAFFPA